MPNSQCYLLIIQVAFCEYGITHSNIIKHFVESFLLTLEFIEITRRTTISSYYELSLLNRSNVNPYKIYKRIKKIEALGKSFIFSAGEA